MPALKRLMVLDTFHSGAFIPKVRTRNPFALRTATPRYTIMEPGKYTAAWKTSAELGAHYGQMESWAQIVYDHVVRPR